MLADAGDGLPAQVLDEAAEWLLRLHDGDELTPAELAVLEDWRARHPDHQRAWDKALGLLGRLREMPPDLGRKTLARPVSTARRRALQRLALLLAAAPSGWLAYEKMPWRAAIADHRTAVGERREWILQDGTRLVLNTDSRVDVRFDAELRRLRLHTGEILVATGRDAAARPFFVETPQGRAQAIGTRFSVRRYAERSEVSVFDGAVDLRPATTGTGLRLHAGQRGSFTRQGTGDAVAVGASAALWAQGMLVAENLRLLELVAELDRYRPGRLRCAPAAANLRISGAFPLADIPRCLRLIEDTLPVRLRAPLAYWAVIELAAGTPK